MAVGMERKWPWGVCGLGEGVSDPEEGTCVVPGREAVGCGRPWGDGGVVLSRGETRGKVLEGRGRPRPVCPSRELGCGWGCPWSCHRELEVCAAWRVSVGKWFGGAFCLGGVKPPSALVSLLCSAGAGAAPAWGAGHYAGS